jgi:hypothetical protein
MQAHPWCQTNSTRKVKPLLRQSKKTAPATPRVNAQSAANAKADAAVVGVDVTATDASSQGKLTLVRLQQATAWMLNPTLQPPFKPSKHPAHWPLTCPAKPAPRKQQALAS